MKKRLILTDNKAVTELMEFIKQDPTDDADSDESDDSEDDADSRLFISILCSRFNKKKTIPHLTQADLFKLFSELSVDRVNCNTIKM